jgi:hypothetical protein
MQEFLLIDLDISKGRFFLKMFLFILFGDRFEILTGSVFNN